MTEKERAEQMELMEKSNEQDAYGNNLASLRANLKRTPTERLLRAQSAARSWIRLKNAIKRTD